MRADGTADAAAAAAVLDDYDSSKEMAVEMRCHDAFTAILHFERTHCLALQARPLKKPLTMNTLTEFYTKHSLMKPRESEAAL